MRKPDIVILPLNSACAPFEDENDKQMDNAQDDETDDEKRKKKRKAHMDTNATAKPKNLPWKDILACIEFKRKTDRKKAINGPPSSYNVNDYVPTKPEYLPVDRLKIEDSAPVPSQTRETQPASDNTCK
jgi:hypothetical protein